MPSPAASVGGIVLCGGHSVRMGTAKEWLTIGKEHLLQRIVRIVGGVVHPVVTAARREQPLPALPPDVEVVYDAVENAGPLAGMAAGFEALAGRCEAAFVVSCDHPLLKPAFITRLIELLGDHQAVVPSHEARSYPLVAVYRLNSRPLLAELAARGERRVHAFAERCCAHFVSSADLLDVDPTMDSLRNVNDRESYEDATRDFRA
jgi:molybdopterin-guanine dinucleotide biosynthesis protein A